MKRHVNTPLSLASILPVTLFGQVAIVTCSSPLTRLYTQASACMLSFRLPAEILLFPWLHTLPRPQSSSPHVHCNDTTLFLFFFLHQISPTPLHFALVIEIQDETFLKCDNTASSIVSIFFPPAKYYLSLHFSFQDFTSLASSQKTSHQVPWKGCFRCPYLCVCSGATAASVREGQDCPCHTQLVPHRAHRRAQLSPALTLLLPLEIPIRKGQNAKLQWGTKHEEKPYNVKLRRSTGK